MSNGRVAGSLGSLRIPKAEPQQADVEEAITVTRADAEKPRRGRAMGKNRNPEFHKLTVYIPKKTRQAVAIRIATDGGGLELSVLVTKLLDVWTAERSNV